MVLVLRLFQERIKSSSTLNLHYLSYLKFGQYSNRTLTDFECSALKTLMWPDFQIVLGTDSKNTKPFYRSDVKTEEWSTRPRCLKSNLILCITLQFLSSAKDYFSDFWNKIERTLPGSTARRFSMGLCKPLWRVAHTIHTYAHTLKTLKSNLIKIAVYIQ